MAKLKCDRPIDIELTGENVATIPKDEVWKVSIGLGSNVRTNLFGGGTNSKRVQGPRGCIYPASPSSTSTSKRLHGGDAPWLKGLFSTDRLTCSLVAIKMLRCRVMKYGVCAYIWVRPMIPRIRRQRRCFLTQATHSTILQLAAVVFSRDKTIFPGSPLKSWRNNAAEGVTLYA